MELHLHPAAELYLGLLKQCLVGMAYDQGGWDVVDLIAPSGQQVVIPPGLLVLKQRPFDVQQRTEGRDWPALGYTMVGCRRLDNIRSCVEEVLRRDIPGDLLEAGVWRGGAAMYMRALLKMYGVTDRTVWLADSFAGMPVPSDADNALDRGGDLSRDRYLCVSEQEVQEAFRRFDLLDDQVRFVKGWFKETLASAPVGRLAILRLDGDLYTSTMDALRALYPKVSAGGFVIVDDYYSWKGCQQAVTEFRGEHGITAPIEQVDWTCGFWQVPMSSADLACSEAR